MKTPETEEKETSLGIPGRKLARVPRTVLIVLTTVAIITAIIFAWSILLGGRTMYLFGYLCLLQAFIFPLSFIFFPPYKSASDKVPWYDWLLAVIAFAIPFIFFLKAEDIILAGWEVASPTWAAILAIILWVMILEACRRTVGLFFVIFIFVFSVYPLFAGDMPGVFKAISFPLLRVARYQVLSMNGVNGTVMSIIGQLFFGFFLFGAVLMVTGAGRAFLNIALALFGTVRGGAAKVAIMGSGFIASITGSTVTNVLTVGAVTIPAMKRSGYPPVVAGAIETCAATGGVLMPPVMGAVAFLMAALLDISYASVAMAALIPMLLYYWGLFVGIDGYAAKAGIKGMARSELPRLRKSIMDVLPYVLGIVILIWMLLVLRREGQAPFLAMAYLILIAMVRRKDRLGFRGIIELISVGGKLLTYLISLVMGIGLLLGSLSITGIAQTFAFIIVPLAGGNPLILLFIAGGISFVLGMGGIMMTSYLLLVGVVAPALIASGLDPLSVHLFLVYYAMLAYITPPICIAAYSAGALAGAPGMATGFRAVRLGIVIFIIPFLFVLNPAFILHSTPMDIIHTVGTGFIGVTLLASGIEGYLVGIGRLGWVLRIITVAAGVLLFLHGWNTDIIGVALVGVLLVMKFGLIRIWHIFRPEQ